MKLVLALLFSFSFIQVFAQNVKISGEITNPNTDSVQVFYWAKIDGVWIENRLDSAKLDNGKFDLTFKLDSATNVQFNDGSENIFMYLAPGDDLNLTLNTKYFDETVQFTGKGSARNNALINLYIVQENIFGEINHKMKNAEDLDTTELFAELLELEKQLVGFVEDLRIQHPSLGKELDGKIWTFNNSFERFPQTIRDGIKMEQAIGQPFMSISGVDLEGNKKKTEDYYGKLIVLDFWATWCGPCKYEMPFLTEIEKEFHGKVDFLSVGVWCKEDAWREMAPTFGFELNMFLEKEEADKLKDMYALRYIPRYMILDAEGKIISVAAERPSGDLSKQLNNLLND